MKVSDKFPEFLEKFEGCKLEAYKCPAGIWTIGIGSTIFPNGTKVASHDVLASKDAAYDLLTHTVGKFEKCINESVKVHLTQNQFDALVSFAYNVGTGNFKSSTLLKLLNEGLYDKAASEFLKWNKGGGHILPGLVTRRAAEKELFLTSG